MMKEYQYILILVVLLSWCAQSASLFPHWRLFVSISLLVEVIAGKYIRSIGMSTIPLFNLYALFCVAYYLFIFGTFLKQHIRVKIFSIFLASVIFGFCIQPISSIQSFSYAFGMLLVMVTIFTHLFALLFIGEYKTLSQIPHIYLAMGILIFYCSAFPLLLFVNKFNEIDKTFSGKLFTLVSYGNIFLMIGYLGVVLCQMNFRKLYSTLH